MSPKQDNETNQIIQLIDISWLEALLGGLMLIALSTRAALSAFFTDFGVNKELHEVIAALRGNLNTFTSQPLAQSVISVVLWGLVGLALVSLLWALVVIIIDTRNDIVVSEAFLHPHSFHRSEYWIAAIARRLLAITLLSTVIIYVYMLLRGTPIIYDSVLSLFSFRSGFLPLSLTTALLALGTWLAGWHLTVIIHRLSLKLDKELAKVS